MSNRHILIEGRNCWRIACAQRAAFLIDGEAYFSAFRAAIAQAQQSILVLGWDINSRIELIRNNQPQELPGTLRDFLNEVVSRRRSLHAHILAWDFAMIYALERELLPVYKLDWRTHHRLHFRMDNKCPVGYSHHQKVVVVDDTVAFVGGFDLSKQRWDTPEHRAHDPRRIDPDGTMYPPFHDVQMIVDGDVAAILGDLARERWLRATGRWIRAPERNRSDPWPTGLKADIENVNVAIARTQPCYKDISEAYEVERLYLDAISAARRFIYIENQYLTSDTVGKALAARLREQNGPEVLLVLPRDTVGWLERNTMDVLRARLLKKLRAADQRNRLRVYYPEAPGLGNDCISVHAKVMVVDDTLVRVGSSNLSNRSMGLDSECDLAVEAGSNPRIERAIARFRNRLMGEHLGVVPEDVGRAVRTRGSLIAAVEGLRGSARTLRELDGSVPESLDQQIPDAAVIDPERPVDPERLVDAFIPKEEQRPVSRKGIRFVLILAALLALAGVWRWTSLEDWLNAETAVQWTNEIKYSPFAPLVVVGGYVLGGLIALPVTLMIVISSLIFGPAAGFAYSLAGSLLSATVNYAIGHAMGRNLIKRLAEPWINRLSQRLARRGLITIIVVRVLPVAPFSVINMVAGAFHIRFRDFLIGTLLGMAPGMLALSVFVDRLHAAVRDPRLTSFGILAAVVVVIVLGVFLFRRWVIKRGRPTGEGEG